MASNDLQKLAALFRRLGWLGVWIQAALAIVPLGMIAYLLLGKLTGATPRLGFIDSLALVGLALLLFTTLWSYRYTRLADRLVDSERTPPVGRVQRTLWTGLWAGCAGVAVSLLLMFVEVVRLLLLFLKTPQGGVPVLRTDATQRSDWVSAIDVVTLLAELCTLAGELVVIGLTLRLLFAVTRRGAAWEAEPAAVDAPEVGKPLSAVP